jgi:hypothetical protein
MFRRIVSCIAVLVFATASEAAQLAAVEGAVFVDYGVGFKPVAGGAVVTAGNRVRTGDGTAQIVYDNGCTAYIGRNQAALVLATPPNCSSQSLKDAPQEGPSTELLLVGGLLIAGGATALILTNNNNKPASP